MRVRGLMALAIALCLVLPARAVADEAELQRRLEQLEEQQRKMLEEMKSLRQELDKARAAQPAAAKPEAAPAKPAAPVVAPAPVPVQAAEPAPSPVPATTESAEVKEVERRQGILTEEVRRLREMLVLPETAELKSYYGLGPAASKVYTLNRGLSIGGYGEFNFKAVTGDKTNQHNEFDYARLVLYVGYKFNDWIVFNSEIEWEHAETSATVSAGPGAVEVEFATLDFLFDPHINARAGLVLLPVGFINEIHEPPFYLGNVRPPVETQILPTTWRANGFGIFGEIVPGLEYRTYGITSLNAKGYTNENIRNARQQGNREIANDWSWAARLDYSPIPGVEGGGSLYMGNQGQGELYGNETDGFTTPGVFTQIYELHAEVQRRGFWFRLLGATTHIDDAATLSIDEFIQTQTGGEPIASDMLGIYTEVAYDVMPFFLADTTQYLAPWFRYSWLDTQNNVPAGFSPDRADRRWYYEFGLQYRPITQVVLKLDYHIQDQAEGEAPDELRIGGGFVF